MAARADARSVGGMSTLVQDLPVTERRVEAAGVFTAVLEGGDGPTVVLLHGPAGNATHWLRVIPELAITHRVVAPDLPGHGASLSDGDVDAVAWLRELIAHTCTEPPVVVGYALGGAIAARFAVAHGDALSALVLVDTLGLTDFDPAPDFGLALNDFLAEPTDDTHDALWRHCAFDLDALRMQMGERWEPFRAANVDGARSPGVLAGADGVVRRPPISPASTTPTTLIWGRHDKATRAGGRRGGQPPARLAAARDRGLRRRPAGRAAGGVPARAALRARHPWRSRRRASAARSSAATIRATTSCARSTTA